MKILFYGTNYYPESIGIAKYSTEMCEWLADQGHQIEVITGMPSYPHWKIMANYKGRLWFTEIINGVKVHRCPLYIPYNVTGKSRILHELSFAVSSMVYFFVSLFRSYDVVICVSPPLQVGLIGVIYKIFHKTLFIYHIQDLQLDAAKQLGLIRNRLLLNAISKFENFILSRSHFVSTISEGMKRNILSKNVPKEKLIELKNWIDTNQMVPREPDQSVRELFGIDLSKKIVLYSGNIGEKQGIDIIIEVAERLKHTDIFFLIIGDGANKNKLEKSIAQKKVDNVKIFPLQPYEHLNKVLNLADIHLVLQKNAAADLVMPSKLTAILSVGGVAIVTAEAGTTLYDIIIENNMAFVIEPENPVALSECILKAINNDSSKYKRNARAYAERNLDKQKILTDFQDFLEDNLNKL